MGNTTWKTEILRNMGIEITSGIKPVEKQQVPKKTEKAALTSTDLMVFNALKSEGDTSDLVFRDSEDISRDEFAKLTRSIVADEMEKEKKAAEKTSQNNKTLTSKSSEPKTEEKQNLLEKVCSGAKNLIEKISDTEKSKTVQAADDKKQSTSTKQDLTEKIKSTYKQVGAALEKHDIDKKYTDTETISDMVERIAWHEFKQGSNTDYIADMKDANVKSAQKTAQNRFANSSKATKEDVDYFSGYFENTAKLNNVEVEIVIGNSSEESGEELTILYAEGIEDTREAMNEAILKEVPEDTDDEIVKELVTSSEKMTTIQAEFAGDLIKNSNMSDEKKEKYLKKLAETVENARKRTLEIIEKYWTSVKESEYKAQKEQINKNNLKYEQYCKEQDEINKKIKKLQALQDKIKYEEYKNKQKIKRLEEQARRDFFKNGTIAPRYEIKYAEAKTQEKKFKERLSSVSSKLDFQEIEWSSTMLKRRLVIDNSFDCIQSMQHIANITTTPSSFT